MGKKSLVVELTVENSQIDIGEIERANPPLQFYPPKQKKVLQDDPYGVADASQVDPFAGNAEMNDPFGSAGPAPAKSSPA